MSGHKVAVKFLKFIPLGFQKFHVAFKTDKETHSGLEIAHRQIHFGVVISGPSVRGFQHI